MNEFKRLAAKEINYFSSLDTDYLQIKILTSKYLYLVPILMGVLWTCRQQNFHLFFKRLAFKMTSSNSNTMTFHTRARQSPYSDTNDVHVRTCEKDSFVEIDQCLSHCLRELQCPTTKFLGPLIGLVINRLNTQLRWS